MGGFKHSEESKKKISESLKSKIRSDEHKINRSKSTNTSGYFHVTKAKDERYTQGFIWRYRYYKDEKKKSLSANTIEKLEQKVKSKGLKWLKL